MGRPLRTLLERVPQSLSIATKRRAASACSSGMTAQGMTVLGATTLGAAGSADCSGALSFAGHIFRTRLTAVRMVVRAWSFATGLVRINSAPRRKAVGRPAPAIDDGDRNGCCRCCRDGNVEISLAAGSFSQIDQHQVEAVRSVGNGRSVEERRKLPTSLPEHP